MPNQYLPPVITIPSSLEITDISRSFPMEITVFANSDQVNTYIPGQLVRLTVPYTYGMWQANGLQAEVVSVDSDTIIVNVDSTNFDVFSIPLATLTQPASLAPAGSRNLQYNNFTNTAPFQNLNNIGN